jgi:hypothetical protein
MFHVSSAAFAHARLRRPARLRASFAHVFLGLLALFIYSLEIINSGKYYSSKYFKLYKILFIIEKINIKVEFWLGQFGRLTLLS